MAWIAEQLMRAIQQHQLGECVTYKRLIELTGLEYRQVQNASEVLERNGFVDRSAPGCLSVTQEGLAAIESGKTIRSGTNKPKTRTRRAKTSRRIDAWRAMRIKKGKPFTLADIISLISQGTEKNIQANIGKYVSALESAGYLVKMAKRLPGSALTSNGFVRWRLEKDTGSQAPIWRQNLGMIYDPNTGDEIALLPVKREVY